MTDITPLVQLIIAIISAALTFVLIPYIRTRTSAQRRTELIDAVRVAVQAAEQIYKGTGMGTVKKHFVEEWLAAEGFTADYALTGEALNALIESAVLELKKE